MPYYVLRYPGGEEGDEQPFARPRLVGPFAAKADADAWTPDADPRRITLNLSIDEGAHYRLAIFGPSNPNA